MQASQNAAKGRQGPACQLGLAGGRQCRTRRLTDGAAHAARPVSPPSALISVAGMANGAVPAGRSGRRHASSSRHCPQPGHATRRHRASTTMTVLRSLIAAHAMARPSWPSSPVRPGRQQHAALRLRPAESGCSRPEDGFRPKAQPPAVTVLRRGQRRCGSPPADSCDRAGPPGRIGRAASRATALSRPRRSRPAARAAVRRGSHQSAPASAAAPTWLAECRSGGESASCAGCSSRAGCNGRAKSAKLSQPAASLLQARRRATGMATASSQQAPAIAGSSSHSGRQREMRPDERQDGRDQQRDGRK